MNPRQTCENSIYAHILIDLADIRGVGVRTICFNPEIVMIPRTRFVLAGHNAEVPMFTLKQT